MSEMDDLAAFAVLIEAGSFTLAAQQLGCSKGQLSKRISQLEAQFCVVLLQRTTRRLSLTAAGAALLPQAQALVVQVERARQALARLKDDMAGPVRMTVPVSLGETFSMVCCWSSPPNTLRCRSSWSSTTVTAICPATASTWRFARTWPLTSDW
ncbi:DNA-binding transcriptional LysR family regulator [Pseudomonas baetica]|nr:DNA-binding transcriptional LysR family regulator [Pseudomonas baetica]